MKQAIYKIINLINNKCYIGSSANVEVRWDHHRLRLRAGDHHNKHLQAAWNKYGENNFLFVVIEYTDNLIEREQFWIDKWQVCDKNKGYNKRVIAESNLGMKHSDEVKQRMSAAQKGKKLSSSHLENVKNRKFSEQGKLNMSLNGKKSTGRKHSEETKAKVTAALIGRVVSEETKVKIAASLKGRKYDAARCKAMSEGKMRKRNGHIVETKAAKE